VITTTGMLNGAARGFLCLLRFGAMAWTMGAMPVT
jgi:hypothetical protein